MTHLSPSLSQGSAVNKFYVHNDIFRYEEEVFGDSEAELGGKVRLSVACSLAHMF